MFKSQKSRLHVSWMPSNVVRNFNYLALEELLTFVLQLIAFVAWRLIESAEKSLERTLAVFENRLLRSTALRRRDSREFSDVNVSRKNFGCGWMSIGWQICSFYWSAVVQPWTLLTIDPKSLETFSKLFSFQTNFETKFMFNVRSEQYAALFISIHHNAEHTFGWRFQVTTEIEILILFTAG